MAFAQALNELDPRHQAAAVLAIAQPDAQPAALRRGLREGHSQAVLAGLTGLHPQSSNAHAWHGSRVKPGMTANRGRVRDDCPVELVIAGLTRNPWAALLARWLVLQAVLIHS